MPAINRVVELLLFHYLGHDTDIDDDMPRYHPESFNFSNDSPDPDFAGFTKKPLLEAEQPQNGADNGRKCRIERKGNVLVFIRYDLDGANATVGATGHAIECEPGSDAEAVFMQRAVTDLVDEAAAPLREVLQTLKVTAVTPDIAFQRALAARLLADFAP